jgi:DNA-binding transcriptional regulator YhcF (GntR family)
MIQEPLLPDEDAPPGTDSSRPAKDLNVTVLGENQGAGNHRQGWLQSDKAAHDFMWKVGMRNATALPLLHYMVAHIRRGSGGVVVSATTLSKELGVTVRTIQNAVAILKKCNFIQVLKSGNTNVYVINSQIAWQGKRGARHATFNATIKVHEDEQEASVDQLIKENAELIPVPEMSFFGDLNADVIEMAAPDEHADQATASKRKASRSSKPNE